VLASLVRLNAPTQPRIIAARARDELAVQLRVAGRTFAEIAQELGCSTQVAHAGVKRVLRRRADELRDAADSLRQLEAAKCDALEESLRAKAMAGDVKSVEAFLRVMARRASLLGLDVAKAEVVVAGQTVVVHADPVFEIPPEANGAPVVDGHADELPELGAGEPG
jgi:hypothetical protein